MKLSIERIYYPVKVLGPGNRIGIWVRGCAKRCPGCISPEMQEYDIRKEIDVDSIVKMIMSVNEKIDGITISGGEPFFKPEAMCALVEELGKVFDDILIFTGYSYEELKQKNNEYINRTLEICSALIDGSYEKDLHTNTGLRGSTNQKCIILKNYDRYKDIDVIDRGLQVIVSNNRVISIGIP